MKTARCKLKSASPLSMSKFISERKQRDETHQAFEERSWRQRCHVTPDGQLFLPPMYFKNALAEAAKYKSVQVPGKGKSTYTKHFVAGVMVVDGIVLPTKVDDVQGEWLHVPSDGRPGGGTRVEKCFPLIPSWQGDVEFLIFDELIDQVVFETHLRDAGQFIGVGRFRPRNNGYYGRFVVDSIKWSKE
jgi:hypothetical protein